MGKSKEQPRKPGRKHVFCCTMRGACGLGCRAGQSHILLFLFLFGARVPKSTDAETRGYVNDRGSGSRSQRRGLCLALFSGISVSVLSSCGRADVFPPTGLHPFDEAPSRNARSLSFMLVESILVAHHGPGPLINYIIPSLSVPSRSE